MMPDILCLGPRTYSSWSMRIGLLVRRFQLPVEERWLPFDGPVSVAAQLEAAGLSPAQTVPTLITQDGTVVSESLAIAEELASRHPDAGLWPKGPAARAFARSLAAEMHAGFAALRRVCPMNLATTYEGVVPDDAVRADLARIDALWARARSLFGVADGVGSPWLCGTYSIADAFFAPVATRIVTYRLPISPSAKTYIDAHLADPTFRTWRAEGLASDPVLARYEQDFPKQPWPDGPMP